MSSRILRLSHALVATAIVIFLACFSLSAQAIPKAAEHADAPVTIGADVLHPRPSSKAIAQKKAVKKSRPTIKMKSTKRSGKSPKATHRKK